jgi:hypothetical protein
MRNSFIEHLLLDRLALAVEFVEQGGNTPGLCFILDRQQARAERRVTDAPA